MIYEANRGNFWAEVRGIKLRDYPDIPLRIPPLIDSSLHKLAVETGPQWVFRVRQRGSWRTRTSPKISVFVEQTPEFGLSFHIGARPLYSSMVEVFADLQKADFRMRGRTLQVRNVGPAPAMDELAFLQRENEMRAERIRKLPRIKPSNVVDISQYLPDRETFAIVAAR